MIAGDKVSFKGVKIRLLTKPNQLTAFGTLINQNEKIKLSLTSRFVKVIFNQNNHVKKVIQLSNI
jgi:hypothetical protein